MGSDLWLTRLLPLRSFPTLILDKHAELHGSFGPFHSAEQIEEVNAIISAYTPDEFAAAVALAKSRRL